MKKLTTFFLLLFMIKAVTIEAKNIKASFESYQFDSLDVIVVLKPIENAPIKDVAEVLKNMPGVKYIAFCDSHSLFLLYIDKTIYADKNAFSTQLEKKAGANGHLIKVMEESIYTMLDFCSPTNPEDGDTIKSLFNK